MRQEVIVGSPNGIQYNMATRIMGYDDISENSGQYWVHRVLDDHVMLRIYKSTPEGVALAKRIAAGDTEFSIINWLKLVFIRHAPPETLLDIIENISTQRFIDGSNSKQFEMRRVLGLEG